MEMRDLRMGGTCQKFVHDTFWVFVSQFLEIRFLWFWSVVMASFLPLTLAGLLLLFGGLSQERIAYTLTGSLTYAIATQAGLSLGQKIGRLKARRVFDYYASLPISKLSFICGLYLEAVLLCVPSFITLLVVSYLAFGLRIVDALSLLMAFIFGGFSLAGLGSVIGFYSRSAQIASTVTQVVDPIIVFFAPVYVPEAAMPSFLRYISRLFPTTYIARLFRSSFGMEPTSYYSIAILIGFVILSIVLVHYGLDWRGERPLG